MRNMSLTYGEILDNEIYSRGIEQVRMDLSQTNLDALYFKSNGLRPAIAIHKNISNSKRLNHIKLHELINHKYCPCDMFAAPKRTQIEYTGFCRRQEVLESMPLELLVDAVTKYDCENVYELSEFLEIPEEDVEFGLEEYAKINGLSSRVGDYIINWQPFYIEKINKRG